MKISSEKLTSGPMMKLNVYSSLDWTLQLRMNRRKLPEISRHQFLFLHWTGVCALGSRGWILVELGAARSRSWNPSGELCLSGCPRRGDAQNQDSIPGLLANPTHYCKDLQRKIRAFKEWKFHEVPWILCTYVSEHSLIKKHWMWI